MTAIRSIADSVISSSQCHPITHEADPAILALATPAIINPVAVANIEAVLGAVLPDRVLNEPGEGLRKRWIELPGIDPLSHGCNNVGTAAGPQAAPYKWFALNRARIPVRCRKLCTMVSMAIMDPPTSA